MATKPAKKAAPVKNTGRPSKFTQALADNICEQLGDGHSLRSICAKEGMPSMSMVMRWLADERLASFREQYARAREVQADRLVEDILEIADEECTTVRADKHPRAEADEDGNVEVVFDATAVARNKLRVDARKWVAAKLAPKKYGDKITQEHTGAGGESLSFQVVFGK